MRKLRQGWHFILGEPFVWLYCYFRKIDTFMNKFDAKNRTERLEILLRLILPIFLVSYPISLISAFFVKSFFSLDILLEVAIGLFSGLLIGIAWEVTMNRPVGILGGMWFGIWLGMWAAISWFSWIAILLTTVGGLALGAGMIEGIESISYKNILKSVSFYYFHITDRFAKEKKEFSKLKIFFEIACFFIVYYIGRANIGINGKILQKTGAIVKGCIIIISIGFFIFVVVYGIHPWEIVGHIWWAVTMGCIAGLLAGVALSQATTGLVDWGIGIGFAIVIGSMLGNLSNPIGIADIILVTTPAIVTLLSFFITMGFVYKKIGSVSKTRKVKFFFLVMGIIVGIIIVSSFDKSATGFIVLLFPFCYIIGYCQLPLLLMDFISMVTVRSAISHETSDIFALLYSSSLYWNKWKALPIPYPAQSYQTWLGLDTIMGLAMEQDIEQATEILTFIEAERPFLLTVAQSGVSEVFGRLLDNIEMPEEIAELAPEDITEWTQYFTSLQTLAIKLNLSISSSWLDFVKNIVDVVADLDIEKAIDVVNIIGNEQNHGIADYQEVLRVGFLQLIAHVMKSQKTLRDISETIQQFADLQVLSTKLDILDLDELFTLLNDVCLDAVHYHNSLGWQVRYDALQNMITNLRNIRTLTNSSSWTDVSNHWEGTAQYELDKLQQEPRKTDQINNPYVVGPALQPGTSLFVGRRDLVRQLELGLGRGGHRPTFFLNGERRMGKSSTLQQLPFLLNTRHFLPIFFDLQAPELTSSIVAFLSSIAERMNEAIEGIGIQMEALDKKHLQEAKKENEAAVYYVFNEWLKLVERVLEQNNRIVLLSFDEFENLEMVGKAKYLDLHLLLNWFRSVIQNRPQLAILFSGGKSVSELGQEMELNWSGYFVNVQTLRVSFLHEVDARHLITRPIPDYPIEQIFGFGVVDEIIRVTSCHPFLVQAVCSNLVNNLNADGREQAEIYDVTVAVAQVLENWEDYFQDLWKRTDPEQQACLIVLNDLGRVSIQEITQHIYRNRDIDREILHKIRYSMQMLIKRDLVLLKEETYQIATPIFCQWVEGNS